MRLEAMVMTKRIALLGMALLLCGLAMAQMGPGWRGGRGGGVGGCRHMMMGGAPVGAWWKNSEIVKQVGLTDAQVQQIEQIFLSYRPQLMSLHMALRQKEAGLQPLVSTEPLKDSDALPRIDEVATTRADLEKVNGRMLLAMRHVLTAEQWRKLEAYGQGFGTASFRGSGRGMATSP
jgi:Spy/CpxP family protein refolding chaperone